MPWERHRMLIWGQTYPELSQKYKETVCTGAVFLDRPGLIRIYPMNLRYMDDEHRPRKWHIIEAGIQRPDHGDPRPESRKIDQTTMRLDRVLDTSDGWYERRKYMLRPEHMVEGMADMEARQASSGMSLGIMQAVTVEDAWLEEVDSDDLENQRSKYQDIVAQQDLWDPGSKPVPPLKYKPHLRFRGPGDTKTYDRVVLDWETCELAKRCAAQADPTGAFREHMLTKVFSEEHEPYIIVGNITPFWHVFAVVCIMYPKKQAQGRMF
jgi:hypothetical protein